MVLQLYVSDYPLNKQRYTKGTCTATPALYTATKNLARHRLGMHEALCMTIIIIVNTVQTSRRV